MPAGVAPSGPGSAYIMEPTDTATRPGRELVEAGASCLPGVEAEVSEELEARGVEIERLEGCPAFDPEREVSAI